MELVGFTAERVSCCIFVGGYIEEEGLPRGKMKESSDVKRGTKKGREGKRRSTDGKENFIFGGWFK